MVCGAEVFPLCIALLRSTSGEAGLPLGMACWLGTGEARLGAEVGTDPLAVAVDVVLSASGILIFLTASTSKPASLLFARLLITTVSARSPL